MRPFGPRAEGIISTQPHALTVPPPYRSYVARIVSGKSWSAGSASLRGMRGYPYIGLRYAVLNILCQPYLMLLCRSSMATNVCRAHSPISALLFSWGTAWGNSALFAKSDRAKWSCYIQMEYTRSTSTFATAKVIVQNTASSSVLSGGQQHHWNLIRLLPSQFYANITTRTCKGT